MLKIITSLILVSFTGCSSGQKAVLHEQKILSQDYSFLVVDNEIHKLHQSNDTIYELHCYLDRPCALRPERHYKILSATEASEIIIIKLEGLDTIALSTNHYPPTRYVLLALRNVNDEQLGYLPLRYGLTKTQIDTIQTDIQSLQDKFFFTYFSDVSLKKFTTLKPVVSKNDAEAIIGLIKSGKYQKLIATYKKTKTQDMYASGMLAELFNEACIDLGYNPIGAGLKFNTLMK